MEDVLPTENGTLTAASLTSSGWVVHRSGMNSSPRGKALGSE